MTVYLKRRSLRKLEDIIDNLKKSRNDEPKQEKLELYQDNSTSRFEKKEYILSDLQNPDRRENIYIDELKRSKLQKIDLEKIDNSGFTHENRFRIGSELNGHTDRKKTFTFVPQLLKHQDNVGPYKESADLASTAPWRYSDQLNSLLVPSKRSAKELFQKSILDDKISETKCEKCNKRFYRRSQLIRHIANHVVHECSRCNSLFYCVRKFKRHMATHESWPCEFCNEVFYEASAWYKHRATHTMVGCASCHTVFYNKSALIKHKIEHMSLTCPSCHGIYDNISQWSNHRVFKGKPCGSCIFSPNIVCKVCRNNFLTQDAFLNHECKFYSGSFPKRSRRFFSKEDISDLIGFDRAKMC